MIRFRLLGPLEVCDGDSWREISAPKWRAALAVLLLNADRVVSVGTLADGIWGDYAGAPNTAAGQVKVYISRLRKLLGDPGGEVLCTRSPGYILRTDGSLTDLQVFEGKVREGQRALTDGNPEDAATLLAEALALWRGFPLADVPRTPRIEGEQFRLDEARLHAAELHATAAIACGRYLETAQDLRRLLTDNPLHEQLWLLLMQALDGAGHRTAALEAYRNARTHFAEELGLEPSFRLTNLHHQLLNADTAPARRVVPPESPGIHAPDGGTGSDGFGCALTAAVTRAGLTVQQAADMTTTSAETIGHWCAGSGLPPLTGDGLAALRAILAACGITGADQLLTWTDTLIRAHTGSGQASGPAPGRTVPLIPDAPGHDLCPDPLRAHSPAELVCALAEFRAWAGNPPFRVIEQGCARQISIATISTTLRSTDLPPLRTLLAIVEGCGGTSEHQQRFATAWRKLRTPAGRNKLYPVCDTA